MSQSFEFAAEGVALHAEYISGDINRVDIEEQWPASISPSERRGLAYSLLRKFGEYENKEWLQFVGKSNVMELHDRLQRFGGMLEELGFAKDSESTAIGSQTTVRTTLFYPSVERLNRFRETVLGENGLTFVRYEGGQFGAFESMAAFINEGEAVGQVWIGSEPGYEVHDTTIHALPDLVTSLTLNKFLRSGWGKYLDRARDENVFLAEVPALDYAYGWRYFRPAESVVLDAAQIREEYTAELCRDLFWRQFGSETDTLHQQITAQIENLYHRINRIGGGVGAVVLENIWGEPPSATDIANEIIDRCQVAEATCASPTQDV